MLHQELAWGYCFHHLISQCFSGEHLSSFLARTEEWTEKWRVFLRIEKLFGYTLEESALGKSTLEEGILGKSALEESTLGESAMGESDFEESIFV
jgi:hypothetical protein